jgi:predicted Rossmann fold flavoprotein
MGDFVSNRYDVIVVGAGPAGMMAAGQAAHAGAQTLLLERMDRPGRKLQLTGKGRCNLTNTAQLDDFIGHFGRKGRFLHSSFSRFFSEDLILFLRRHGIETQVERGGRVFPISQDALEIVHALEVWNEREGVELTTETQVQDLIFRDSGLIGLTATKSNRGSKQSSSSELVQLHSKTVIIATGGASYPGTGSSGDGYRLAKSAGHSVTPIRPALVPLVTGGTTAANLQGLSLRNVRVKLIINGEHKSQGFGEMLFTHFGLSGPVILSLSRDAVDGLLAKADVQVSIDLKPALDEDRLDARLLRDLESHGRKQFRSLLKGLLPQKMISTCLTQTGIQSSKPANQITAEERQRLKLWLKDFSSSG